MPHYVVRRSRMGRFNFTLAKSDGKPEVGKKQTFLEAVQSSGLSEEQRKRLLAMAEAEIGSD